jgi:CubicO group peptidase (beta-lactamase class C family)
VNRLFREAGAGCLLAGALAFSAQVEKPAAPPDDALVGIWSYETAFGEPLHGELTIVRRPDEWRAVVGDREASFKPQGVNVEFAFPGELGRFRGRLDGERIRGFWIRPGVTKDPRHPGGSSQPFATPMTLAKSGEHTWLGVIRPLPNPFTLYLRVFRGEDGALMAAFRNPEQNSRGPASQYRVAREGDDLALTAGENPAVPTVRLEAKLLRNPDRIRIAWEDAGGEIDLERRSASDAADFFPRPPGSAPYVYREPPQTGDGWETAHARNVGIDQTGVAAMVRSVVDGDPAARRPSLIHAVLVARQGRLVVEEYFFGFDRDTPHDLRSAGKTFSSVLLGSVMRQGVNVRPSSRLYTLMRDLEPFANPDPRKAEITLAHLMTHSAGLACNDYDDASPGNENRLQTQTAEPDWWKYTLDLPMAHDPGARYAYCSANINLMGGVLRRVTKTWLPQLFAEVIAEPLQFGEWHWNLMPTDEGYLGGGAFLRPRDLLKVGQVYLDGGRWKNRRIVDAAWVEESTRPVMKITPASTGLSAEAFGEAYAEGADALAWHMNPIRSGEEIYDAYAATGNGGQVLLVIPALEMTVVFTGGNYLQGGIWSQWGNQLIGGHIIPAIRRGEAP